MFYKPPTTSFQPRVYSPKNYIQLLVICKGTQQMFSLVLLKYLP